MPTNNKTSLGLNSWLGTDKPKRSDFVEDNALLDTLMTAHFNNALKLYRKRSGKSGYHAAL